MFATMRAVGAGAGEARVGVAVEAEAQAGAVAFDDADRVGAVDLDVLAHGFEPVGCRTRPG